MLSFDIIAIPFENGGLGMSHIVKQLRTRSGLSQVAFASLLGVSVSSLRRWEAGDTMPSPMAKQRIEELNNLTEAELLEMGQKLLTSKEETTEGNYGTTFFWKGKKHEAQWAPYVINGPIDQKKFYDKLVLLQEESDIDIEQEEYFSRLSMLKSIDGHETAQFKMEAPKNTAKSWSSDYGTHGFHRYVGRFPSHLIRSLINSFGATKTDTILDPFCGSGTTLVEARMLGVKSIGIEISPLSAMISRVKSQFPIGGVSVAKLISEMQNFYQERWVSFLQNNELASITHTQILQREGNSIKLFPNIEKWFSKEALLGTSIMVEFIMTKKGYLKDFLTIALSSKMRSIGNVDVDVVRAEYRKSPRENVDVLALVTRQLQKMARQIQITLDSCKKTIGDESSVRIIEGSVLNGKIKPNSISHIITSPPYGVESLSYLRTHLLSFRALEPILGVDPYNFGEGVIGSEYLISCLPNVESFQVKNISDTFNSYFKPMMEKSSSNLEKKRIIMMMQFFEDMYSVIKRFSLWIKPNGNVAFIIGNKKLGNSVIPTDTIIEEIFRSQGFRFIDSIAHKLKTNNSNSKVPWQDRIIENEFVLLFRKG